MPKIVVKTGLVSDPLLNINEILQVTTLGLTTLKNKLRDGEFPPPCQISECRVAWRSSVVQSWIDQRPVADAYRGLDQDSTE